MTPATLARAITPKTVAVVPDAPVGLAVRHGRHPRRSRVSTSSSVIEDCAHALGATYRGQPVGTIGDAALFSFQTLKPLNTYGGGMAVTRDAGPGAIASRALVAAEPAPTESRW